jgi:hypothetical protein
MRVRILLQLTDDDGSAGAAEEIATFAKATRRQQPGHQAERAPGGIIGRPSRLRGLQRLLCLPAGLLFRLSVGAELPDPRRASVRS